MNRLAFAPRGVLAAECHTFSLGFSSFIHTGEYVKFSMFVAFASYSAGNAECNNFSFLMFTTEGWQHDS